MRAANGDHFPESLKCLFNAYSPCDPLIAGAILRPGSPHVVAEFLLEAGPALF